MTNEKLAILRPISLVWKDMTTKRQLSAGVAFYDEKFAEYRLKLDIQPETQYFLKPVSSEGGSIQFRVEVVIKKDGKFHQRKTVGEGKLDQSTFGDVYIDLGPYSKTLVMLASKYE